MEIAVAIAVIIAGLVALTQIRTDPRFAKDQKRIFRALGFYMLFLISGCVVLIFFVPFDQMRGLAVLSVVVGIIVWLLLGVVWLLRIYPGLRPPPAWVLKPWTALDWVLIGVVALSTLGAILL
jgi:hypothetical protein